jgi:hypothetical protein
MPSADLSHDVQLRRRSRRIGGECGTVLLLRGERGEEVVVVVFFANELPRRAGPRGL